MLGATRGGKRYTPGFEAAMIRNDTGSPMAPTGRVALPGEKGVGVT